jgi:methylenetetrahydrofolate dehydrogenase (NADP+)/methenyltetrahydrofolate cyclohydrolase
VRNKVKACEQVGIHSVLEKHPESFSQAELLARVEALNNDPTVSTVSWCNCPCLHISTPKKSLKPLHLPKTWTVFMSPVRVLSMTGLPAYWPCTPHGCMKMLESIGYKLEGKHAVVIGRSNIVGKPMALMLLQENATVTVCHSATTDLKLPLFAS